VCGVLQQVLSQRPGPSGAALRTHLLCTLPGAAVPAEGVPLLRLLPPVPLDHLHQGQPDPARSPVGQHGDLGQDSGGQGEGEGDTISPDGRFKLH